MPAQALDLLDTMLELDPARRITSENALKSPWLSNIKPQNILPPKYFIRRGTVKLLITHRR